MLNRPIKVGDMTAEGTDVREFQELNDARPDKSLPFGKKYKTDMIIFV